MTKDPSRSALTFRSFASWTAICAGVVIVNAKDRSGLSSSADGTHANPNAAPTESPTTPRCTTPAPSADNSIAWPALSTVRV